MKQVQTTKIFKRNLLSDKAIVINRGSARSTKSYSIMQLLIYKMTNEPCKILILRKTTPSLVNTVYTDFINLLKEYDLYRYCDHNKTYKTIRYLPNNAYILFTGLDDPERIKSSEFNYIFIEEANEFCYEDYMILKTRLSAATKTKNHLYMAFNPTDAFSYIKTKILDVEKDVEEIVSSYKDNPFLSKEYIQLLEATKDQDTNYWRIYGLGEWGSLENVIYNNWQEVKEYPIPQQTIYGLDFGYTVETALVEIGLLEEGIFLNEVLYHKSLTNADLIEYLKKNTPPNVVIYADCAEPARIEEMKRHDINVFASDKSVKDGIDYIKRQKIYITSNSSNILKEIRAYSYRKKDGHTIDEPIKINDHAMDAIRYGIYTHLGRKPKYQIVS